MPASITEAIELREKASKLIDEAEKFLVSGTPEEKAKVQPMLEDAKKLQLEALNWQQIEEQRNSLLTLASGKSGGASAPSGFKSFGEFLTSVSRAHREPDKRLRRFEGVAEEKAAETKDMTGQTGAGGGFLIPVENQATLMGVVSERSIVRGRATIIPMTRRQIQIPVLDQTATTAGQPHWFGGLRAYWQEEASLKNSSDATFRQAVLTAWKLIMYTRASDELLDDSAISLAAFLSGDMGFAGAISWTEDYSFISGSGVGQPLGILNASATIGASRASGGAIGYPDLTGMIRRFLPNSNGVWLISQSAMSQLLELAGPSGNPSYLWGSAVNGAPSTLLGYPVIWTEKTPALGSRGDVMLVDWKYYLIGDRQATTIESTKFDRWEYDETSWRAVHRVDGRPWLSSPLTYQDGSTQVSPFVALNA